MGNFGYKDFGHVNLGGVFRPEQLCSRLGSFAKECAIYAVHLVCLGIYRWKKDCSTIVQPDWQHFMIIFLLFFFGNTNYKNTPMCTIV